MIPTTRNVSWTLWNPEQKQDRERQAVRVEAYQACQFSQLRLSGDTIRYFGYNNWKQLDRYTRGLKPYIWRELCTNEYDSLTDLMRYAKRVESAHHRFGKTSVKIIDINQPWPTEQSAPVPMDIGSVHVKKLTPAECEMYRKESRCFCCREKSYMFYNCPNNERN